MTGDKTLIYPLTDEEKVLVERYHNIIYTVMRDMGLMNWSNDLYDAGGHVRIPGCYSLDRAEV